MSPWEPGPRLLGNLYIIILGTLITFTWKTWDPCREPWRNLEGTLREPFGNLEGTLRNLGNLERTLGTFTWEPLLGNLGTFTWEPLLGTWEPWGNGFWSCSGLLRNLYYGWRPQSILLLRSGTTPYYYSVLLLRTTTPYYYSVLLLRTTTPYYYSVLLLRTTTPYYSALLRTPLYSSVLLCTPPYYCVLLRSTTA